MVPIRYFWVIVIALFGTNPAVFAGPECSARYQTGKIDHWANGRVFYEIFVRSFHDSDGDGIGDFQGLIQKLDYLNDGDPNTATDLGVDGIWLMPINESPSYHGYDVVDYDRIEQDYGSAEDFSAFLKAAHERGIRVVMDLVVNHSSREHPWFVSAQSSQQSEYHDWYVWRDSDPGWTQPWSDSPTWHEPRNGDGFYYGVFSPVMPDLNFRHEPVRQGIAAMALRWLDRGVDGFRLDAARYIMESDEEVYSKDTLLWWQEFGSRLRGKYPDVLLVGEVWTSAREVAGYFGKKPRSALDMNFNFELSGALLKSLQTQQAVPLESVMCELAQHLPAHALDATFLANHDMIRVLTQLDDNRDQARLGASLLFTLPGVPFVYYGEEIGMRNGPGENDPEKRTPMQWSGSGGFTTGEAWWVNANTDPEVHVRAQQKDANSLWHHYRKLIALRRSSPALSYGDYQTVDVSGNDAVFAFTRIHRNQRLLVIANLSDAPIDTVKIGLSNVEHSLKPLWNTNASAKASLGQVTVEGLAPSSAVIYEYQTVH